jgi:hypothetical protein
VFTGAGAFILLQFGFGLAANHSRLISDPLYADKEARLALLERSAPSARSVVVLGSSRTLNGFAAGRTTEALSNAHVPAVAYNFGVPGAGPITQAVYLRRLMDAGHRPAVLFAEVMPALFAESPLAPAESALLQADRLTRTEIELVVERYSFPGDVFRARRASANHWPLSVHRFKLLSRLEPDSVPGESRIHAGRAADDHGWLPPKPNIAPDPEAFNRAASDYGPALRDFQPGAPQALALRDTLLLGREHGVTVALVLMPEAAAFRALASDPGRARLSAFLAAICSEFGCRLIDAREWVADDGFLDGHHLTRAAAITFTDRLTAEAITPLVRGALAPGRAP